MPTKTEIKTFIESASTLDILYILREIVDTNIILLQKDNTNAELNINNIQRTDAGIVVISN